MQDFLNLYQQLINNKTTIYENKHILYNLAINNIMSEENFEKKEFILTKMITLFPNDHELYYNMGRLYKGISKDKELFWYKLSYTIKPDFKENFCDLCDLLLDLGFSNHVFALNKDNLFDKYMNEPRFLTVFTRCNLVNLNYENGLNCLLDLIKINSKNPCLTDYDRNEKWRNYHDAGYLFNSRCDVENSIRYSEKAYELALKFNLELQKKMLSFENILCFTDYLFNDQEKLFKRSLEINTLLPDRPSFHFHSRKKEGKIRIGYLSADFVMHSVSNFILPILNNHNRSQFEIILFSNCPEVQPIYNKLGLKIHYVNILSAKDAATLINNCKIDILFDLMGHTVMNKMEIFSYHPAPIQIAYLGFPNTTGLKAIQYRITDGIADSPLTKQRYSEELIRLPKCFLLFEPIHNFIPNPRKTQKKIILGAINKENKSNTELLKLWGEILAKCPNTIILLKLESFDNKEERTQFYVNKLNTTKDRVMVLNKLVNQDYDKLFTMFDILLDPFPYSGTTTTCNSLFNSIPVVTLYNPNYHVHNVSSSLLINCGYPELVANTKEEYINIVVDLVNNPEKIDAYKRNIRGDFLKLMEPKAFMNSYESELVRLYDNSFLEGKKISKKPEKKEDTITITFDEPAIVSKKVYICGCVKNCANFLQGVFINIDKLINLFDDYRIIIAEDSSADVSLEILKNLKTKYKLDIVHCIENKIPDDFNFRSKKISNARNKILQHINNLDQEDFQYMIMLDMDDVCSGNMDSNILKRILNNEKIVGNKFEGDWDSLSFNRKNYYDIWALSVEPYVFSCFHFPGNINVVEVTMKYISYKLQNMDKEKLLDCYSAFNGFSIYRRHKFKDCVYDWQIKKNFEIISKELIKRNENALGIKMSLEHMCHPLVNPQTDCEHRHYHLEAIKKNNAKIRISPLCLFTD